MKGHGDASQESVTNRKMASDTAEGATTSGANGTNKDNMELRGNKRINPRPEHPYQVLNEQGW